MSNALLVPPVPRHATGGAERPLKIVMVAPPYFTIPPAGYGGVEAVIAILADALVDAGHDVTLLAAGPPGTRAKHVALWPEAQPQRLGETYPELMNAMLVRQAVRVLAATGTVDVVHDHTFSGAVNAELFASWGLANVLTVHGPASDPDLLSYYRTLDDTVQMVAISDRQTKLAPDLNWIGTVPNALRVSDWRFQVEKQGYALFLGRFSADKGAHLALDAAHAAGIPLIMAGKCAEPAEKEYFEREVAPRMRPQDVMFGMAGSADRQRLLADARCLLFPIQWEEPFGMVMIEAMACGTPVVALNWGAVPEVVVSGVTGIVCDDPSELPAALDAVTTIDPYACRAHVVDHFDAQALGAGYVTAYRAAMAKQNLASIVR
jgi:glycosyltransferase involved in cell wall biosynthesis